MKNLYFLILLTAAISCKRDVEPAHVATPLEMQGLYNFKVAGVPDENIGIGTGSSVIVQLPQNFSGGNRVKLSFNLPAGTRTEPDLSSGLEYEGKQLWVEVKNIADGSTNLGFFLFVLPFEKMETIAQNKAIQLVLQGEPMEFQVPVRNWGTVNESSSLDESVVTFRNKKSGETISSGAKGFLETPNQNTTASVSVPANLAAGEYEVLIRRRGQDVLVPDPLVLIYGSPKVERFYNKTIYNGNRSLNYAGYNLSTGHNYRLELKNDFGPVREIKLSPLSHLTIEAQLPSDLPNGNYESTLFIDGKAALNDNNILQANLLVVKKDSVQPELLLLSQPSQLHYSYATVFTPISVFPRSEEIVAYGTGLINGVQLQLKNIETQKLFILSKTNELVSLDAIFYKYFRITGNVPNGKYAVQILRTRPDGSTFTSENYHKIITIK